MFRKIIASTLLVTVTWTTVAMAAPLTTQVPANSVLESESVVKRFDRFMELVEEFRSSLDRSQFDLEALLDRLDYDEDNIIRFVSTEIAYEAYQGVLRGATGTLMSRAGNALDQALLLATLLKDAGFDARIARAEIPDELAHQLLRGISADDLGEEEPLGDEPKLVATLIEMARLLGLGAPEAEQFARSFAEPRAERVGRFADWAAPQADAVLEQLDHAGLSPEGRTDESARVLSARDYFWVRYREGVAQDWQDAHPAFSAGPTMPAVEPREILADVVPKELSHRLRVEISVERRSPEGRVQVPLMEPWESPVANLVGHPVLHGILPLGLMSLGAEADQETAIAESDLFMPILEGAMPPGGSVFDYRGQLVPLEALTFAGGIFRTVSKKGRKAISAVGSLGKSADAGEAFLSRMTEVEFSYILISPDGEEHRERRVISLEPMQTVELASTEAGLQEFVARSISETRTLMVDTGGYPQAFVMDRIAERILNLAPLLRMSLLIELGQSSGDLASPALGPEDATFIGHLAFFSLRDAVGRALPGGRVYKSRPTVAVHIRDLDPASMQHRFDLVFSDWRAGAIGESGAKRVARKLVRLGVIESLLEGLTFGGGDSTFTAFEQALESGAKLVVRELAESEPGVSDRRVERRDSPRIGTRPVEVAFGEPLSPPGMNEGSYRYRIDRVSGVTKGIAPNGEGGAVTTEQIILATSIGFGVASTFLCLAGRGEGQNPLKCALCGLFAGVVAYCALTLTFWEKTEWPSGRKPNVRMALGSGLIAVGFCRCLSSGTTGGECLKRAFDQIWEWADPAQ